MRDREELIQYVIDAVPYVKTREEAIAYIDYCSAVIEYLPYDDAEETR